MSYGYCPLEPDTQTKIERLAAERGCVVRYERADELFIDIDSARAWRRFARVSEALGFRRWEFTRSPSRRPFRRHVVVHLARPVRGRWARFLLRVRLGSDIKLELARLLLGWRAVFFERKGGGL